MGDYQLCAMTEISTLDLLGSSNQKTYLRSKPVTVDGFKTVFGYVEFQISAALYS